MHTYLCYLFSKTCTFPEFKRHFLGGWVGHGQEIFRHRVGRQPSGALGATPQSLYRQRADPRISS